MTMNIKGGKSHNNADKIDSSKKAITLAKLVGLATQSAININLRSPAKNNQIIVQIWHVVPSKIEFDVFGSRHHKQCFRIDLMASTAEPDLMSLLDELELLENAID